jgi:hypothetical protein
MGGISPEYYSIRHYSVEKRMVNHNNGICIYIGLNRSNYIASGAQFIYLVVYVWFPGKCIINY